MAWSRSSIHRHYFPMMTSKKILLFTLVCVLIAASIYVFAYIKEQKVQQIRSNEETSKGKVSVATIKDGTYTTQIHSIKTSPEDTTITFRHVTYFDGTAASSSATKEVPCKDQPLVACVPTLTRGYYVRKSEAPDFTAPVTAQTVITLKDQATASTKELRALERLFEPVFDVVILEGNIVSLSEKSPL